VRAEPPRLCAWLAEFHLSHCALMQPTLEPDLARDADREFTLVATTRFPGLTMQTDADGRPQVTSTRANCGGDAGRASASNRGVERVGGKPGMKEGLGSRGIDGEPQSRHPERRPASRMEEGGCGDGWDKCGSTRAHPSALAQRAGNDDERPRGRFVRPGAVPPSSYGSGERSPRR
jgi:hypothetical protein